MCIIAIYNKTHTPDKKTLDVMIKGNPDGVGVAWNDGKNVHFIKGISTSEEVLTIFNDLNGNYLNFIFHARIATSGGISPQKCHPFLLSDKDGALNATHYDGTRPCVFHNGVFALTPFNNLNDTQTLVKSMLAPLYFKSKNGLYNGDFNALIQFLTRGNRFVIMHPDKIQVFGNWITDNGVQYSNGNYKPYTPPKWATYKRNFALEDGFDFGDYLTERHGGRIW